MISQSNSMQLIQTNNTILLAKQVLKAIHPTIKICFTDYLAVNYPVKSAIYNFRFEEI